jgi:hypothetical protein
MKGILTFNLPQENEEFELAQQGWQYKGVINDLDRWLRNKIKHGDLSEADHQSLTEVREFIQQCLFSYGVDL